MISNFDELTDCIQVQESNLKLMQIQDWREIKCCSFKRNPKKKMGATVVSGLAARLTFNKNENIEISNKMHVKRNQK